MTDINPINAQVHPPSGPNPGKTQTEKTDVFGDMLNKAFDKKQVDTMEQLPIDGGEGLREIAPSHLNIVHTADIVSGGTDKLLSMLEEYSSQLRNPEMSLKHLAPALEEIRLAAGNLQKEINALAAEDETLKEIADRTIVAAQTEYYKFQRGDYLS